jgi:hypothetical protein
MRRPRLSGRLGAHVIFPVLKMGCRHRLEPGGAFFFEFRGVSFAFASSKKIADRRYNLRLSIIPSCVPFRLDQRPSLLPILVFLWKARCKLARVRRHEHHKRQREI